MEMTMQLAHFKPSPGRRGWCLQGRRAGRAGAAALEDCTVEGNGAHGVLLRDGARPSIALCSIRGNAGYGVLLKDGGGVLRDNTLSRETLAAPPQCACRA